MSFPTEKNAGVPSKRELSAELVRKLTDILNKLTADKFNSLSHKLANLLKTEVKSLEMLKEFVSVIFEKALDEPNLCAMCAELCKYLNTQSPTFSVPGDAENSKPSQRTFKRILISMCQEQFEKPKAVEEAGLEAPHGNTKRRRISNIIFIGELYKELILIDKIMHVCIFRKLLRYIKDPDPEDIESVCMLMNNIGSVLDKPKAKRLMDTYFGRMREMSVNPNVHARLQCLLLETLELRANSWRATSKLLSTKPDDVTKSPQMEKPEIFVGGSSDALEQQPNYTYSPLQKSTKSKQSDKNVENGVSQKPKAIPLVPVYPEGRWSPSNPEGKKQYNIAFLMTFARFFKSKPPDLPEDVSEIVVGVKRKLGKSGDKWNNGPGSSPAGRRGGGRGGFSGSPRSDRYAKKGGGAKTSDIPDPGTEHPTNEHDSSEQTLEQPHGDTYSPLEKSTKSNQGVENESSQVQNESSSQTKTQTASPIQQISFNDLKIEKKPIAKGAFGKVYKGKWYGSDVACKQLKEKLEGRALREFHQEVSILNKLKSPFIVPFFGISTIKGHPVMVMEFCEKGSLLRALRSDDDIPWPTRISWGIKIGFGLAYLHQNKIIHNDLAARNILLDNMNNPKICDFGLSKTKVYYNTASQTTGMDKPVPLAWTAPERLTFKIPRTNEACDVYSFGVLLWEIASRETPLNDLNDLPIDIKVKQIAKKNYRDAIPDDTPDIFANVITICEAADPQKRPTAKQAADYLESGGLLQF